MSYQGFDNEFREENFSAQNCKSHLDNSVIVSPCEDKDCYLQRHRGNERIIYQQWLSISERKTYSSRFLLVLGILLCTRMYQIHTNMSTYCSSPNSYKSLRLRIKKKHLSFNHTCMPSIVTCTDLLLIVTLIL